MNLEVTDLTIELRGRRVVDSVSFSIPAGQSFGIIGESGSGKSLTVLAILGLLPEGASVTGSIRYGDRELVGLADRELAQIRGDQIGIVFQEPQTALSPLRRLGKQMTEALRIHYSLTRAEERATAIELATRVGLPNPDSIVRAYPHQVSGGQRQRAAIAAAIATNPRILIADEPTTALDVTVQKEILALFRRLTDSTEMSLVFITHDLAVLSQVADQMIVLHEGRVIERGTASTVLRSPRHSVTQALVSAARELSWKKPSNRAAATLPGGVVGEASEKQLGEAVDKSRGGMDG
ncbi:ABC transporter ATP-binding protein [Lysinibacter sp. HNR]|uniref:ABC transporter ATP-binding protein n=1 Tax=Lysinibacter sp. HNR TaxID=3031408 RepID=UPI0024349519|nr:ABC transporter ATP-binding protein [Lysinibacter sp. HNR]WGD36903.1 ABC transporter ATP-binding protein [Lysinibacter sp. HNR]